MHVIEATVLQIPLIPLTFTDQLEVIHKMHERGQLGSPALYHHLKMTIMTDTRSVFAVGNHALESTGSGRHSAALKTVIPIFDLHLYV